MADHKNQHFVPRCVLKPFTLNNDGKAINLYNPRLDRSVENAPVKHQCSRDYLYGEDGVIEAQLAQLEADYVRAISRVLTAADTDDDRNHLRFFAYLQLRRTEMAIKRLEASEKSLFKEVFGSEEPEHQPTRYYMVQSLNACLETQLSITDLKVVFLENRSDVDFVISDDPAIFANRYAVERISREMFGVQSSGLILGMPITPKLAILCYDGKVYETVDEQDGRIILVDDIDAEALNEFQCLRAANNIYFSRWESREYVREQFFKHEKQRIERFAVFEHLIPSMEKGRNVYRVGTAEEARKAPRSILHSYFKYPFPSRWLSKLPFRKTMTVFTNLSEAGYVRKPEWLKPSR